ncbi:hypothetical protein BD309DRAFT_30343 [Dichomitus squalens]|uniref:Uncharacterized protein n=1 Tax=Dichomitus squalens TaxID=114155 RepID=A0A4Q9PKE2_9APHY|nr:hypothetical protein BD309DRAFT_30343 [Dichomitus squalens]TBU54613.1 hypothetical protein BD310DRAFT_951290 [Dichomitus squalens]
MFIYNGKFTYYRYALDETITFVFPVGFALNDPVNAYWQWTVDAKGNQKPNTPRSGIISSVVKTADEYRVHVSFGYYRVDVTVAADFKSISFLMRSRSEGPAGPFTLPAMHAEASRMPSTVVYTGKLNWRSWAENEMITLVIPDGVFEGAFFGLYHQWTVDAAGNQKTNYPVNGVFQNVSADLSGAVTATSKASYYTYDFSFHGKEGSFTLLDPNGDKSEGNKIMQTDFRSLGTKKALIVRYGTGTDDGIFYIEEMLTKHLGFATDDVELLYYDVEPSNGAKQCTKGQKAPTVGNFETSFADLVSGAEAGDVRFVYIDAHGTTYPGENDRFKPADGKDYGWVLAAAEDGVQEGLVDGDWFTSTIRSHLKSEVNLTILASSSGGAQLGTYTKTPGILLSGCHETQFNIKAVKRPEGLHDPWAFAVAAVIKDRVANKRSVPAYSVLFNEAKRYIKKQLDQGLLNPYYKGFSPDELQPVPPELLWNTSHQDPQLVFDSGYVNPDQERFLFPFVAPGEAKVSGQVTRYPQDEV